MLETANIAPGIAVESAPTRGMSGGDLQRKARPGAQKKLIHGMKIRVRDLKLVTAYSKLPTAIFITHY